MKNIIKGFLSLFFEGWKSWQKERLDICHECAPNCELCPVCKCFIVAKVKVKSEKCPLGKWQ